MIIILFNMDLIRVKFKRKLTTMPQCKMYHNHPLFHCSASGVDPSNHSVAGTIAFRRRSKEWLLWWRPSGELGEAEFNYTSWSFARALRRAVTPEESTMGCWQTKEVSALFIQLFQMHFCQHSFTLLAYKSTGSQGTVLLRAPVLLSEN